jgi:hypothetical protein
MSTFLSKTLTGVESRGIHDDAAAYQKSHLLTEGDCNERIRA